MDVVPEAVRDPVAHLRPELDYLRTVCAGLSLPDPVAVHLEPLVGGWSEMTSAASDWSRLATALESLAEEADRIPEEPVATATARAHRGSAAALREAAEALERTSTDAGRLVADAAELLADVGRTASLVLSLPALGAESARRIVLEGDERARVCAESVHEVVGALADRWHQLTVGLQGEPVLATAMATAGSTATPAGAVSSGKHDVLSAGGVRVAVTTTNGAHVEVTALPPGPALPAAPVTAPAPAVPVPTAAVRAGPEAAAAAAGGGVGAATAGSPPTTPLTGGHQVTAVENGSPARPPASASAPAAAEGGSQGRSAAPGGAMMGMGGAGAGGGGGDTERKRSTRYVADPEEVFGTPQKTAPPVIGERSP